MNLPTFLILADCLIVSMCYLVLASILAAEFEQRNIQSRYYGYMLGIYALCSAISSLFVSNLTNKYGRSCVMYLGLLFMGMSLIATGLITYIEDNTTMIIVAMLLRATQGFFKSFTSVTVYSMLVILNPNEKIKYISICEVVSGFGYSFGPIVGSILYSTFGYFTMFLVLGLTLFVLIFILKVFMPSNVDNLEDTQMLIDANPQSEAINEERISYYGLLEDHVIKLLAGACLFAHFAYTYYEPILSFRLLDFTRSVHIQSLVFFSMTGGYAIMAIFITCLAKCIKPINLVALSLFFTGVFNFMVGPSTLLPNNLILMVVGLFFTGMSLVFSIVLQIPIMLERAQIKFPSQSNQATDYCSNIFNAVYSIGMFLGPIYGGYMTEVVGYRTCCDIMSIIMISYSLVFCLSLLCLNPQTEVQKLSKTIGADFEDISEDTNVNFVKASIKSNNST